MTKRAVVTGAGSGVGRAVALALARRGWRVALLGRREVALQETLSQAGNAASNCLAIPCDIGELTAVEAMGKQVLEEFGGVDVLVNAAGANVPERGLSALSLSDYRYLVETNLNGAYYCLQQFLPEMRRQRSGTIVNVVSEAGKQASAKSGVAYVVSKFGMAGLTQSINAEEQQNGVRACAIFPGDIDTPLLEKRPNPPTDEARRKMLTAEDVAACVLLAVELPDRAVVEELVIRPMAKS